MNFLDYCKISMVLISIYIRSAVSGWNITFVHIKFLKLLFGTRNIARPRAPNFGGKFGTFWGNGTKTPKFSQTWGRLLHFEDFSKIARNFTKLGSLGISPFQGNVGKSPEFCATPPEFFIAAYQKRTKFSPKQGAWGINGSHCWLEPTI
ncbi:unnamed protein product [Schistosoma intercalatum]|nr:unnamed protein product [Schistosoma intercalatum]CAH8596260.1 unnamed protein product [Schistosoma intercalatum]